MANPLPPLGARHAVSRSSLNARAPIAEPTPAAYAFPVAQSTGADMPELVNPLLKRIPPEELDQKHRGLWELVNETVGTGAMIEVLANHPAATDFYGDDVYPRLFYNERGD